MFRYYKKPKREQPDYLAQAVAVLGLPAPEKEYLFARPRRYRFDYAWVEQRIAVEVEGAVYARGRHTRGDGYTGDCRKYNLATLLGWRLLRFTTGMIESGEHFDVLKTAFETLN